MSFAHTIRFEPGHDCRRFDCRWGHDDCYPGSGGFHGVHGLAIRFVVRGPKAAVQFLVYTGWLPEPANARHSFVMAADLGYHSPVPRYDDQARAGPCEWLDGADCYYDGSSLNAEEPFRVLCNEGDEALWQFLERYYAAVFDGADHPAGAPYPFATRSVPAA